VAEDTASRQEVENVLKRQTLAGETGKAKLTTEERRTIVQTNIESSSAAQRGGIVPPEINELLKKQTTASTPGYPDLTEEEKATLRAFYKSKP